MSKLIITGIQGWQGETTSEADAIAYLQDIMTLLYPISQQDADGFCSVVLGSACGQGTAIKPDIPSRAASIFFSDIASEEIDADDLGDMPDDVLYAVAEDTPFYPLTAKIVPD